MATIWTITEDRILYSLDCGTRVEVRLEDDTGGQAPWLRMQVWHPDRGGPAPPHQIERHQRAESMVPALEAIGEVPDEVRTFLAAHTADRNPATGNYHGDQLLEATRSFTAAIRTLGADTVGQPPSAHVPSGPRWEPVPYELKQFMFELCAIRRNFAAGGDKFNGQLNDDFGYALPGDDDADTWEIHFGKDTRIKVGWAWHLELTSGEVSDIAAGKIREILLTPCKNVGCVRMILRKGSPYCEACQNSETWEGTPRN